MTFPEDELNHLFTYHSPSPDQLPKYQELRALGLALAKSINELCPPCADTSAAIRKVREAVFTANASIACERQ